MVLLTVSCSKVPRQNSVHKGRLSRLNLILFDFATEMKKLKIDNVAVYILF